MEHDFNITLNDEDLNDPLLLQELDHLIQETSELQIQPKIPTETIPNSQTKKNNSIEAVLASLPLEEEVHVEFHEHDLQDPELLVIFIF